MKLSQRMLYANEICKFCDLWFSLQVNAVVYPVFAPDLSSDHWFLMAYIPCVVFCPSSAGLRWQRYRGIPTVRTWPASTRPRRPSFGETSDHQDRVYCRSHKQQVAARSGLFCDLIVQRNTSAVLHKFALLPSNYTQYKNNFWIFW